MGMSVNTAAWFKKNRTLVIVAVVIVIVFIIVAVHFYRKGKKTTTIAQVPNDNPNGTGGIVMTGNKISDNDVASFRDKLHDDIHDIFSLRNNDLYADLVLLSDTDLVRVYNAYNTKYQANDSETLLEALKGELTAWLGSGKYNMQTVIDRLTNYNLK